MSISVDHGECTRSPFSLLNLDLLKTLCDAVERSSTEQSAIKALDGLSRTSHLLRNLCLPSILRVVHIRGDWDQATAKVGEMLEYSALGPYVKSNNHITPLQAATLLIMWPQNLQIRAPRIRRGSTPST